MSALSIQPTYPIFTDTDGQPLEDGYVWIGTANLDPQTNPINVYWDAALTLPAAQPIRTLNGYPVNSGTPARLYVNSDYSIRVMEKNGSVVYSAPAATDHYNADLVAFDRHGVNLTRSSEVPSIAEISKNYLSPTIFYSDRPSILALKEGSEANPDASTNDPVLWAQKHTKLDNGTDRYAHNVGGVLGEVIVYGTGQTGAVDTDGTWCGIVGNAVMQGENQGTASAPDFDARGNVIGVAGFAASEGWQQGITAALWGYASSPELDDATFDALPDSGMATVGQEINVEIRHKDPGYKDFFSGKGVSAGILLQAYPSHKPAWPTLRDWTFGICFNGNPIDGNYVGTDVNQWTGFHTGILLDKIKSKGIRFGRYFKNGSIGIEFPDGYAGYTERPKCAIALGDNVLDLGQYTGAGWFNRAFWHNGGNLWFRKSDANYQLMLNGDKALSQNEFGGVGINKPEPGFNLDIEGQGDSAFAAVTAYNGGGVIALRGAGGSKAAPSATLNNGTLGFIGARGHIGSGFSGASNAAVGFYAAEDWTSTANGTYLTLGTTPLGTTSRIERIRVEAAGHVVAGNDNLQTLGSASRRWSTVFAATGTINTSDEREKQQIRPVSEAERAVAVRLKSMIRAFKWNDAVAQKGDDARIHFGVIAQEVKAAFEAEGLDAMKYGVLCYDEWEDQYEPVMATREVKGEDGQTTTEEYDTGEKRLVRAAGNRYGVRHDQLFALIISAL